MVDDDMQIISLPALATQCLWIRMGLCVLAEQPVAMKGVSDEAGIKAGIIDSENRANVKSESHWPAEYMLLNLGLRC